MHILCINHRLLFFSVFFHIYRGYSIISSITLVSQQVGMTQTKDFKKLILKEELNEKRITEKQYNQYENQIESLSKTLAEKDAQLFAANKLSDEKDATISQQDATISQQDALIADLKRQLEEALARNK